MAAAKLLGDWRAFPEPFKFRCNAGADAKSGDQEEDSDASLLSEKEKEFGVGDGLRTRDLLSHSQAFYP